MAKLFLHPLHSPSNSSSQNSRSRPPAMQPGQQPQSSGSYYPQPTEQYAVPPMIVPSQMPMMMPGQQYGQPPNVPQHMLRHGYIAATFGTYGETAYCAFLKCGLGQIPLMFSIPGCTGAYTVAQSVLPHLPHGCALQSRCPDDMRTYGVFHGGREKPHEVERHRHPQ